jgi:RNA polymerase sigma-70 factor (ECF subfamily)
MTSSQTPSSSFPAVPPARRRPSQDWLATLLASMQGGMHKRALLFSGNREDAQDAVQQACERAWRRRTHRVPPRQARAWLLRILHNVLVSAWRARRRHCRHALLADLDTFGAPVEEERPPWQRLALADVELARRSLPPSLRLVHQVCDLEGVGYEEAARRLGIPRATVGTRLFRARRRLRGLLAARVE